jgi:pimeloyl-ACP methyl ester carboxylesterase
MKLSPVLCAWLVASGLAVRCGAESYTLVRLTHNDKSETNVVMSVGDLQRLKDELKAEAALFPRALASVAEDWKEDKFLKGVKFPSFELAPRKAEAVGTRYDSQEKAEAARVMMSSSRAWKSLKRPGNRPGDEKGTAVADAVELLTDHFCDLKESLSFDAADSKDKIALAAGQLLQRSTEGPTRTVYHIAVPDRYDPARPPPLLVVFSPGGDGLGMLNQVRASANRVGWIVIGCDSLKNGMKDEESSPIEKDLMDDIRKLIPYDRTRLYYGGFSGGALRGYCLTVDYKDRCAGILAFGGWLGGPEGAKRPFQKRMTVAIVNGDKDEGALAFEQSDKAALEKRRCEVKVFRFPGGHTVPPPDVIDEAVNWLEQQALERKARAARKAGPPAKPGAK